MTKYRSNILGVVLLVLAVPALSSDDAAQSAKNYDIVFHTKLSGQAEDVAMTISEGNFHIKITNPMIMISGILEVSEDFMHRLEYDFRHVKSSSNGEDSDGGGFYERSGSVVLEPGKTVQVIKAPDVELSIELRDTE